MELLTDRGGGNHFYSHTQQKAEHGVGERGVGAFAVWLKTLFSSYGKLAFEYGTNL